jgi:hypothetical protein
MERPLHRPKTFAKVALSRNLELGKDVSNLVLALYRVNEPLVRELVDKKSKADSTTDAHSGKLGAEVQVHPLKRARGLAGRTRARDTSTHFGPSAGLARGQARSPRVPDSRPIGLTKLSVKRATASARTDVGKALVHEFT